MRNLKITYHAQKNVEGDIAGVSWDLNAANDTLVYTRGPTKSDANISLCSAALSEPLTLNGTFDHQDQLHEKRRTSRVIASWAAPCPLPDLECDRVLSHLHNAENQTSCLVLEGGDIVTVRHDANPSQNKIEIVGTVDVGLRAAAWSPDESLLALVTKADTFLLMTQEFEPVADVTFKPDDSRLSKHVSVGWGKAETQFKGKGAKALRDPTLPEKTDDGELSPLDDGSVNISWRGDGAFVAVNSIEPSRGRMIRFYTREGVLDSVSEPTNALEGNLSWRPEGNLVAGMQRTEDIAKVVFFERNGLRHGDFALRLSSDELRKPIQLQWNVDSSVLAVAIGSKVELWTQGNYHYYLKQTLDSATPIPSSAHIAWHPEDPLRLALWTAGSTTQAINGSTVRSTEENGANTSSILMTYSFHLTTNAGPPLPPNDLGLTVVVDGKTLNITALGTSMVPPPFSQYELNLSRPAIDVAVSHDNSKIAVLYSGAVDIYSCAITKRGLKRPTHETSVELSIPDYFVPTQLCFKDHNDISVLCHNVSTNEIVLVNLKQGQHTLRKHCLQYASLYSTPNFGHVYVLVDETVFNVASSGDLVHHDLDQSVRAIATFPRPMIGFKVWETTSQSLAVGLSSMGVMYLSDRKFQTQCTSFEIAHNNLVFTTSRHVLKFVKLDQDDLEPPSDDPETDSRTRSIERGGRLVSIMPSAYSVVLQMPRGNLETIYPRPLVIAAVCDHIEKHEYLSAFLICRSQRVDLNLLYDYAPIQFLNHISSIIQQLHKVEHIDLLLSQLSDLDTVETLYKGIIPTPNNTKPVNGHPQNETSIETSKDESKVNRICEAFLKVLPDYLATNLQNTITAHLCKKPPDIEAGLLWIQELQRSNTELVDDAIEHILFLADPNQVYDSALGLYDLELTLLIAQQSQKDPREYLPYLQNLQNQSPNRRRFTVDNDLGRYVKALEDLHQLEAHEELRKYTERHQLYTQAMNLYRYDSSHHDIILKDFADFLMERNRFEDAAVAFETLCDFSSASECYRAANKWRESLATSQFSGASPSQIESLALSLAESLEESKDFSSSARIRIDYLSDIQGAINCLCKGHQFSEAIRLAANESKQDLVVQIIDPGLVEASASLTEVLSECRRQLGAQIPRLRELRLIKQRDPLAFYEGETAPDIPDDISLAPSGMSTTGGTFMTRYTNRTGTIDTAASHKTSKNRRREERKRARGKKGSIYEEEYLVNSIGRLIDRVNSMNEEVSATIKCLLRRAMKERARAVEDIMAEVVQQCKDCIGEVWETDIGHIQTASEETHERPSGAEGVLWDSLEESKRKAPPVLVEFRRSTLIGS